MNQPLKTDYCAPPQVDSSGAFESPITILLTAKSAMTAKRDRKDRDGAIVFGRTGKIRPEIQFPPFV
jgi:hypothetical protein